MENMHVEWKTLKEIKPYEKNPRKNEEAVQYVANSIKEFGWKQPIVVDKDGIIIAGHTRYKAAQKLGIERVPVITADDLTKEQVKAYRLADNKTGEFAQWDIDILSQELDEILGIDMDEFGFEKIEQEDLEDVTYTKEVKIPQYECTGEEITLKRLLDRSKAQELIREIEFSGVTDEEKEFLIEAAKRHNRFNYRNIAEYYAQASPEMQQLMERSALVIIDIDDAIANGYATLNDFVQKEIEDA